MPEDRAKALAFLMEKGERCVFCGTAPWEWDPKQGGSRFAYEGVEKFCQGCYVKEGVSDQSERKPGVTVELSPTGTQESARRQLKARDLQQRRKRQKNR